MAEQERRSRGGSARRGAVRGERLEGLFCEELNSILNDEIGDPRLAGVHITRVDLARDGSSACIWFATPVGSADGALPAVRAAFARATGFLRYRLTEALPLKRGPELRFKHDPAAASTTAGHE